MGEDMIEKPRLAVDYTANDVELVRAICLTVARVLGSYIDDITVIGGLVPFLLVPQDQQAPEEQHIGTADLDLVLQLGLLEEGRYKEVSELLRRSGFEAERKADTGAIRFQRWVAPGTDGKGIIEFLLPPAEERHRAGKLHHLEKDFGAFVLPGGQLAFEDRLSQQVTGKDLRGAETTRAVWVAGPAAFLILKALAHKLRDEPKDAYDIWYLVRHYPGGSAAIADRFPLLRDDALVREGRDILEGAFRSLDSSGPRDVALFSGNPDDEDLRQDVSALILDFLRLLVEKHGET